jgi:hypothetical protein
MGASALGRSCADPRIEIAVDAKNGQITHKQLTQAAPVFYSACQADQPVTIDQLPKGGLENRLARAVCLLAVHMLAIGQLAIGQLDIGLLPVPLLPVPVLVVGLWVS